jgi:catechol 2,3-dioxygenase-like lactoylglutathione lyase family enzyme
LTEVGLDHVQIATPQDSEDQARAFYGDILGLKEVAKPSVLANRGGLWFVLGDGIGLHLGIDPLFRPATKAHPGLIVEDLEVFRTRLFECGFTAEVDVDAMGRERVYIDDPFGNRIELIGAIPGRAKR